MSPATKAAKISIDPEEILARIQASWLARSIHDLTTPVSVARGYVRMALEEKNGSLPPLQRRYLIKALEEINRLAGLTRELRDFPSGNGLTFGMICVKDLLRQSADSLHPALSAKNVRLVSATPDGALCTIGDSEKLATALRAFLSASVDAAKRGGKVRVEAGEDGQEIFVRFSVTRDSGITTASRPLEIAAACKLWRLHGGSVTVDFAAENGDVVMCELPVVRPSEC